MGYSVREWIRIGSSKACTSVDIVGRVTLMPLQLLFLGRGRFQLALIP